MKNLAGILGLALKAGALAVGTEAAVEAMRGGKAVMVFIASDVSENTLKKITDKAAFRNIRTEKLEISREELAKALGKSSCSAAALTDKNFIAAVEKYVKIGS